MGKRMGIVQLSDPSGQYEAVIFEEGLAQYRELLEVGNAIMLLVGADLRPEGVSIRIQKVESLEARASRTSRNLRIYLRDDKPVAQLSPIFAPIAHGGEGRISFVIIQGDGDCEIEVELREGFRLNPKIAGAVKGIPGVLDVELV